MYGYNVYDLRDPVYCRFPIWCKDWDEVLRFGYDKDERFCIMRRQSFDDDRELSSYWELSTPY